MKKISLLLVASVLLLTGCAPKLFTLPLSPVPFAMKVDPKIVAHLQVADATGDFSKQAKKDGALSQAIIYYQPQQGKKVIFMSVYLFPKAAFDKLANPNQPPSYGQEVLVHDGDVLSVAGPSDSIFDPSSPDGKNVSALYKTIYESSTYESIK